MSAEQIVLVARMRVRPDAVEKTKAAVLAVVEPSRAEEGCLNYDVHQAIDEPTVFVWHETWVNKAALDAHFAMPYFEALFAEVTHYMEEPTQITLSRMISSKA